MIHYANQGDGNIPIKSWNDTRRKRVPFGGEKQSRKEDKLVSSISVSSGNSPTCVLGKQGRLLSKGAIVLQAHRGADSSSWLVVRWKEKREGWKT